MAACPAIPGADLGLLSALVTQGGSAESPGRHCRRLDKVRFVPEEGWRLDNRPDSGAIWYLTGILQRLAEPRRPDFAVINGYLLDERLKSTPLDPSVDPHHFPRSAS